MKLLLTNKDGKTLDLLNNEDRFVLTKADGLHGVDTDIGTSESPYMDGVNVVSVKALPRGISLTLKLKSDIKSNIDFITNIVKSKQLVTLTEEENDETITIKGIATIPPYTRMLSACLVQIDIYCGQPYWEDVNTIIGTISSAIELLNFPDEIGQYFAEEGRPFGVVNQELEKSIENDGDVAVGMIIRLVARGNITNPSIYCSTGEQRGNFMKLNISLKDGDELEISTVTGNKYIKLNNREIYLGKSLVSYLEFSGQNWLQLETGINTFNAKADSGAENIQFLMTYKRRFE